MEGGEGGGEAGAPAAQGTEEADAAAAAAPSRLAELKRSLWEGWGYYLDSVPLGDGQDIELEKIKRPDPDIVGFAYPLPPVPFEVRNPRRFPPPSEDEMFAGMCKLVRLGLVSRAYSFVEVLDAIYQYVGSNSRDAPAWQRAFIKVGGIQRLKLLWRDTESKLPQGTPPDTVRISREPRKAAVPDSQDMGVRYYVVAIIGRMLGTIQESRVRLIKDGMLDIVLEAAQDHDENVRECGLYALKGVVQHPEGRQEISYDKLIGLLGLKR
eukprot:CAMPEP_0170272872 /NCGR_PEP_ID=MMETSP0116_2-20130129/36396_1 /TAXON_ID=400756 /ORGANISM="Durinskia baltica, Strain CSIRO CS-38" /LENGTH=266 /DNA_ID=CAMNT_0010524095 /DNA_START=1 /DNA_END=801 /DNA_ORIENTATION=+